MMKIILLVQNTATFAQEILHKWSSSVKDVTFFRASSNYVYKFKLDDNAYCLRLSHSDEKSKEYLQSELDFITFLTNNNYPAMMPISSLNGKFIEDIDTSIGRFYGIVFTRATGQMLEIEEMTDEQFNAWGASLGRLHKLSMHLKPTLNERNDLSQVFSQISDILDLYPEEQAARFELEYCKNQLDKIAKTDFNYGLIHYDFELDNIFWDKDKRNYKVIDFDDAIYGFRLLDIASALRDLRDLPEDQKQSGFRHFIDGYNREMESIDTSFNDLAIFYRFVDLHIFAKILRSIYKSETAIETEWLPGLRRKLAEFCDNYRKGFIRNE